MDWGRAAHHGFSLARNIANERTALAIGLSVAVNSLLLVGITGALSAGGVKAKQAAPAHSAYIEVALVSERRPPPPVTAATPTPADASDPSRSKPGGEPVPKSAPAPSQNQRRREDKGTDTGKPTDVAPPLVAETGSAAEIIPELKAEVPAGLKGLLERDGCDPTSYRYQPDCPPRFAGILPPKDWDPVDVANYERRFGHVEGVEERRRRMLEMRPGVKRGGLPNSLGGMGGAGGLNEAAPGDTWGCVSEACFHQQKMREP